MLRCAFAASVRLDLPWGLAEEEKEKSRVADQERIQKRIDSELTWLAAPNSEPAWPEFPIQQIRPRDYWRNGPRDHVAEAAEYQSVKLRVDYQRAALWLKQTRSMYEVDMRPWLRAVVSAYAEWTRQANGFGQEKDAQYDGQPDGWNEPYFELAAQMCCRPEYRCSRTRNLTAYLPACRMNPSVTAFLTSSQCGPGLLREKSAID